MEILRLASLKTTQLYLERLERRELLDSGAVGIAYGQIPLSFEANQGQTDPAVQFLSHGSGYALFLTSQEAVLSLSRPVTAPASTSAAGQPAAVEDVLQFQLVGANPVPRVAGHEHPPRERPGKRGDHLQDAAHLPNPSPWQH